MASTAAFFLLLFSVTLLATSPPTSTAGGAQIATYWGQDADEGSLKEACDSGLYEIINIAHLNSFGSGRRLGLHLAGHCSTRYGRRDACAFLGPEIDHCQNKSVKVMLSIGGSSGNYFLSSSHDAELVARQLYHSFLAGGGGEYPAFRPFGDDVALDGIDFDIEGGTPFYWADLARALESYSTAERKVHLSASPACRYPDPLMGSAIAAGVFDYVWVKFFNDPSCEYRRRHPEGFFNAWSEWSESTRSGKLFAGFPAAPEAAFGGYVKVDVLVKEILPTMRKSPYWGGTMIWGRHFDAETGYSKSLKPYLQMDGVADA